MLNDKDREFLLAVAIAGQTSDAAKEDVQAAIEAESKRLRLDAEATLRIYQESNLIEA